MTISNQPMEEDWLLETLLSDVCALVLFGCVCDMDHESAIKIIIIKACRMSRLYFTAYTRSWLLQSDISLFSIYLQVCCTL